MQADVTPFNNNTSLFNMPLRLIYNYKNSSLFNMPLRIIISMFKKTLLNVV